VALFRFFHFFGAKQGNAANCISAVSYLIVPFPSFIDKKSHWLFSSDVLVNSKTTLPSPVGL
jgi:hypothetical protein